MKRSLQKFKEALRMEEIALLAKLLREGGTTNVDAIASRCSEAAGKPIDRDTVVNWLAHTWRRQ